MDLLFDPCMILINIFSKMSQVILKIQEKQLTVLISWDKEEWSDGKDYAHCAYLAGS